MLTAEGLSGKQIGQRLAKSASTVRSLQHQAYERLRVSNVTSAVIKCARAGWIDIGGANPNEAAQQVKLERLLSRLVKAVERRPREEGVTPAQRRYLERFEEHLRAKSSTERAVTENRVSVAFGAMCTEAGINIERKRMPRYGIPT